MEIIEREEMLVNQGKTWNGSCFMRFCLKTLPFYIECGESFYGKQFKRTEKAAYKDFKVISRKWWVDSLEKQKNHGNDKSIFK